MSFTLAHPPAAAVGEKVRAQGEVEREREVFVTTLAIHRPHIEGTKRQTTAGITGTPTIELLNTSLVGELGGVLVWQPRESRACTICRYRYVVVNLLLKQISRREGGSSI